MVQGGRDSQDLYGQVQINKVTGPGRFIGRGEEYNICTGTLISPRWVLTAKHCVRKREKHLGKVVKDSSGREKVDGKAKTSSRLVKIGALRMGEGDSYKVKDIITNSDADIALLELEREAPARHVVGYSGGTLNLGDEFQIRGWGNLEAGTNAPGPDVLQEITMTLAGNHYDDGTRSLESGARWQATLRALDLAGSVGATWGGDSGAGWYRNQRIYAVESQSDEPKLTISTKPTSTTEGITSTGRKESYGVPTSDYATWIQDKSGVAPS